MTGDDNYDGDHPETSNPSPPVPPPTQQIPHTISSIKLLILKKGEYDIWAMKMEHYLSHTDYPIWQVIHNGKGPVFVTTYTNEMIKVLPSKTAEEVALIMRTKPGLDTFIFDDLYNNLKVFERDVKGGHDFHEDKEVSQEDRKKVVGILLETTELKGIKIAEEEMLGTMETKLETMVEYLYIRMIQKLWLPLMERILTGLDILRKMLRTML
nr:ribonuclease H-like domain-containing protein [Tanacetum cinerariifolium]